MRSDRKLPGNGITLRAMRNLFSFWLNALMVLSSFITNTTERLSSSAIALARSIGDAVWALRTKGTTAVAKKALPARHKRVLRGNCSIVLIVAVKRAGRYPHNGTSHVKPYQVLVLFPFSDKAELAFCINEHHGRPREDPLAGSRNGVGPGMSQHHYVAPLQRGQRRFP